MRFSFPPQISAQLKSVVKGWHAPFFLPHILMATVWSDMEIKVVSKARCHFKNMKYIIHCTGCNAIPFKMHQEKAKQI